MRMRCKLRRLRLLRSFLRRARRLLLNRLWKLHGVCAR